MNRTALAVAVVLGLTLPGCGKKVPPPPPPAPPPVVPATPPPAPPPAPVADVKPQSTNTAACRGWTRTRSTRWASSPRSTSTSTAPTCASRTGRRSPRTPRSSRSSTSCAITVEGHCDERGSVEYNLALGERRAKAAYDYLVSLGVPAERLKTVSYGKEIPLCSESNEACWARNRRAHFTVTGKVPGGRR